MQDAWLSAIERRFSLHRDMQLTNSLEGDDGVVVVDVSAGSVARVGADVIEQAITVVIKPFGMEVALPSNGETVGKVTHILDTSFHNPFQAFHFAQLKHRIEAEQGTPVDLQRLLFVGQEMMDDTRSLLSYGIGDRCEVYMVRSLAARRPPKR